MLIKTQIRNFRSKNVWGWISDEGKRPEKNLFIQNLATSKTFVANCRPSSLDNISTI